ncbi:MAG: hypothetical protein HKN82_00825 [Akkermansiaceae bacterium]|nr:hypothetical protein [Akkermansiaceae bacterium]
MKSGFLTALGLALALTGCKDAGESVPAPREVAGEEVRVSPENDLTPLAVSPGIPAAPSGEAAEEAAEDSSRKSAPADTPPARQAAVRVPPATAGTGDIPPAVSGRPGFARNPYTGGLIDMRGQPAGALVRDPADPDPTHTFRVSREVAAAYEQAAQGRAMLGAKQSAKQRRAAKLGRTPQPADD